MKIIYYCISDDYLDTFKLDAEISFSYIHLNINYITIRNVDKTALPQLYIIDSGHLCLSKITKTSKEPAIPSVFEFSDKTFRAFNLCACLWKLFHPRS